MTAFNPTLYFGHPLTKIKGEPAWNRNELYAVTLSSHAVTIASSGGGKSTAALVPNLLTWRGSAVVFDHLLLHEGAEVTSGVKYAVRTDLVHAAAVSPSGR